jgi:sulfoxide reductase heme-binding subunit YedZ
MHAAAKPLVFVLCLLPLAYLVWGIFANALGANPAETLIRSTGDWALRMLCVVLAVTPVREATKTPQLARFRRMLGLFMAFYAALHMTAYAWLDMGFEVDEIVKDIIKRPFILVGFAAFVLLLPLVATSFNRAIKALGAQRWKRVHQAVYLIAGLAVLHFFWMRAGKNDFAEVFVYAAILGALLMWRVASWWRKRQSRSMTI